MTMDDNARALFQRAHEQDPDHVEFDPPGGLAAVYERAAALSPQRAQTRAYGIDLGTTYSCISRIDSTGEAMIIPNRAGETKTPSVVLFESRGTVLVGRKAKNAARTVPNLVVKNIKRRMGMKHVELAHHGVTYTPETVSALILKDLVRSVRESTGETVRDVVITVPAYFGVAERQATRIAGEIAGLNVMNLVPEPVAAAMYYSALTPAANRTFLVYDLGGGTFDATVIRLVRGAVAVVCTDGSQFLGGMDWDEKIAMHLVNRFVAEVPHAGAEDSVEFLQDMMLVAEDMKRELTQRMITSRVISFDGHSVLAELTRAEFEEITARLLQQTMDLTERTIAKARETGVDHIDEVILVGGSTHMPAVAAGIAARFGFAPQRKDPDMAVAKGAALYAVYETVHVQQDRDTSDHQRPGLSSGLADELDIPLATVEKMRNFRVISVVPRAFGVKVFVEGDPQSPEGTGQLIVWHLLHANTPLPTARYTCQFVTAVDNQQEIYIEIWEQASDLESPDLADNKHVGEGIIRQLPPLRRGSPVDVTFQMDEVGRLFVEAIELRSGQRLSIELQIGGMTPQDIAHVRNTIETLSS